MIMNILAAITELPAVKENCKKNKSYVYGVVLDFVTE